MRDKRAKFLELAEKRVNRVIKDMRLVGNLSNTNNYEYSRTDVGKILAALESELKYLRNRFEQPKRAKKIFKLS